MDGEIWENSALKELKMKKYEKNKQKNNYVFI